MIDFAIGIAFASALWFSMTVGIAYKCARRTEALSRYIGALEVERNRMRDLYNGLTGKPRLSVIREPEQV